MGLLIAYTLLLMAIGLKILFPNNQSPYAVARLGRMGERWQLDEFYTHLTTSKTMQPNNQSVTHVDAANATPHNDHTTLLQEVPPWVWMLGAWAVWLLVHPYSALPSAVIGYAVWTISEKQRIAREAAARVGACANVSCPQVVESKTPYESPAEIQKRCDQWREDLRASGNIYAEQIPIIPYPFNPMIYGVGELTYAWDKYRRMVGEVQHQENIKWVEGKCPKELRGAVLSQIIGQSAQPETN